MGGSPAIAEAVAQVLRLQLLGELPEGFRRPDDEEAVGRQGARDRRHHPALGLGPEVDEDVAQEDDVKGLGGTGEGLRHQVEDLVLDVALQRGRQLEGAGAGGEVARPEVRGTRRRRARKRARCGRRRALPGRRRCRRPSSPSPRGPGSRPGRWPGWRAPRRGRNRPTRRAGAGRRTAVAPAWAAGCRSRRAKCWGVR